MLCFKCNEYGHMARSCSIPDNPRYVKDNDYYFAKNLIKSHKGHVKFTTTILF